MTTPGNDGLAMQPDGTQQAVAAIDQANAAVEQAWAGGKGAIDAVKGLGSGKLGMVFMGVYQPEAQRAADEVQALTAGALQLIAAGNGSINDYLNADDMARRTLDGLRMGN